MGGDSNYPPDYWEGDEKPKSSPEWAWSWVINQAVEKLRKVFGR